MNVIPGEELPEEFMEALWANERLNAVDTPYGMCAARAKGNCSYAINPPCLTCSGGEPCQNLVIGASVMDEMRYEIYKESAKRMLETGKQYSRQEVIDAANYPFQDTKRYLMQ